MPMYKLPDAHGQHEDKQMNVKITDKDTDERFFAGPQEIFEEIKSHSQYITAAFMETDGSSLLSEKQTLTHCPT